MVLVLQLSPLLDLSFIFWRAEIVNFGKVVLILFFFWIAILELCLKFCVIQGYKYILVLSFCSLVPQKVLWFGVLHLELWSILIWFSCMIQDSDQDFCLRFFMGVRVVVCGIWIASSSTICWKTAVSPLTCICALVHTRVSQFLYSNSVLLTYLSYLMPVPHYPDYCSFVMNLKIRQWLALCSLSSSFSY